MCVRACVCVVFSTSPPPSVSLFRFLCAVVYRSLLLHKVDLVIRLSFSLSLCDTHTHIESLAHTEIHTH